MRWNEILRELVAKHNLPPYQNEDGTYPIPSANNPLAYPQFPFANPPYAARAYAYVSAAQYDALVAAYSYKRQYHRPAPYKKDPSIKVLVPQNDLPSYPSEDATVAGAAVEMLKLLFPGDQDFIQQKAEEHMHARLIAGANVRSDLDAGAGTGQSRCSKICCKSKRRQGRCSSRQPGTMDQIGNDCIARGETPWYSLEFPKRPPMLPVFGKVKAFLI